MAITHLLVIDTTTKIPQWGEIEDVGPGDPGLDLSGNGWEILMSSSATLSWADNGTVDDSILGIDAATDVPAWVDAADYQFT